MPIDLKSDESEKDEKDNEIDEVRNIPYDPELHDLNLNINKLRNEAENKLKEFIDKSKENPKLRNQL